MGAATVFMKGKAVAAKLVCLLSTEVGFKNPTTPTTFCAINNMCFLGRYRMFVTVIARHGVTRLSRYRAFTTRAVTLRTINSFHCHVVSPHTVTLVVSHTSKQSVATRVGRS